MPILVRRPPQTLHLNLFQTTLWRLKLLQPPALKEKTLYTEGVKCSPELKEAPITSSRRRLIICYKWLDNSPFLGSFGTVNPNSNNYVVTSTTQPVRDHATSSSSAAPLFDPPYIVGIPVSASTHLNGSLTYPHSDRPTFDHTLPPK
ncbi:unnamed protein product [Microthlaspi erraticum]|uniref:Uncharacterized protein n=1 Tax=Microthlaspi erraticum TaxID=1685480 RepID=A0A6D2I5U4_9BRAS|nr:unnamed protein product [Microthlaspi erraticum]